MGLIERLQTYVNEILFKIFANENMIIALGAKGTIISSKNGDSWEKEQTITSSWLLNGLFFKNRVIAVGDESTIVTGIIK